MMVEKKEHSNRNHFYIMIVALVAIIAITGLFFSNMNNNQSKIVNSESGILDDVIYETNDYSDNQLGQAIRPVNFNQVSTMCNSQPIFSSMDDIEQHLDVVVFTDFASNELNSKSLRQSDELQRTLSKLETDIGQIDQSRSAVLSPSSTTTRSSKSGRSDCAKLNQELIDEFVINYPNQYLELAGETGCWEFEEDINCPTTIILSQELTLDCKDYTLSGLTLGTAALVSKDDSYVVNCKVDASGTGATGILSQDNALVEYSDVWGGVCSFLAEDNSKVKHSNALGGATVGACGYDNAYFLITSKENIDGFSLDDNSYASWSVAENNVQSGFYFHNYHGTTDHATALNNGYHGFSMLTYGNNVPTGLIKNAHAENNLYGYEIAGNAQVQDSTAKANSVYGFRLVGDAIGENLESFTGQEIGFLLRDFSEIHNSYAHHNDVGFESKENSKVYSSESNYNYESGFVVSDTSEVSGCLAKRNHETGFTLFDDSYVITSRAESNIGVGFLGSGISMMQNIVSSNNCDEGVNLYVPLGSSDNPILEKANICGNQGETSVYSTGGTMTGLLRMDNGIGGVGYVYPDLVVSCDTGCLGGTTSCEINGVFEGDCSID